MGFGRLLSSIGVGAATVDTRLERDELVPGEEVRGVVEVKGGGSEQKVNGIRLEVQTQCGWVTGAGSCSGPRRWSCWSRTRKRSGVAGRGSRWGASENTARAKRNDEAPGSFTGGFYRYSVLSSSPDVSNHHPNLLLLAQRLIFCLGDRLEPLRALAVRALPYDLLRANIAGALTLSLVVPYVIPVIATGQTREGQDICLYSPSCRDVAFS
jgi:hypothetical protein